MPDRERTLDGLTKLLTWLLRLFLLLAALFALLALVKPDDTDRSSLFVIALLLVAIYALGGTQIRDIHRAGGDTSR